MIDDARRWLENGVGTAQRGALLLGYHIRGDAKGTTMAHNAVFPATV